MKYTNRYILLIAAVSTACLVFAQKLTVTAPNHVAVGEQFRLAYRADSSDASGFTMGNIPSGIEIIHGPSTSIQSNYSTVNGKTTQSSSKIYTFTMIANRKGTYTFPPAKVTVKGQTVYSDAVTIEISGEAGNDDTPNSPTSAAGNANSDNDLFVKATLSKNRVYEQEPVVLTYKIYSLVNLATVDSKTPDIRDCIVNEINLSQQKQFKTEKYNGKNYQTVVWTQYVLYPLRAGEITIPEITYDGTVVQRNRNANRFDELFNGGYTEIKKQIKAPSVTLHVDSLPIFVKATLSKNRVYEQEPVVLTYKIYSQVDLTTVNNKTPDIRDCIVNEINLSQQKQFNTEKYNGRNYQTVVWTQYVLYPLRAGEITIPETTFEGIVQRDRNVDSFDAFSNRSTSNAEIKKQIKTPSVTLHVDSLPKPPMNFSGGYGRFSMSSVMEQTEANAGDTLCLHIKVTGTGNMSLMDAPIVDFPKHFEIVDMEINDETNITAEGQKGNIYYDIKFVPLYGGDYEIPAVELTYFNRDTKNYQTIKDKIFLLHVTGNPAPPDSDEQASYLLTFVLAIFGLIVIVVILILGIYRNRLKKI